MHVDLCTQVEAGFDKVPSNLHDDIHALSRECGCPPDVEALVGRANRFEQRETKRQALYRQSERIASSATEPTHRRQRRAPANPLAFLEPHCPPACHCRPPHQLLPPQRLGALGGPHKITVNGSDESCRKVRRLTLYTTKSIPSMSSPHGSNSRSDLM